MRKSFSWFLLMAICIACNPSKKETTTTLSAIDKLPKDLQKFEIDPKKEQVLVGQYGSLILIEKGSFLRDGNPIEDEKVFISFAEVLDMADALSNGIVTTADGKMIETLGMIYIDAKDAGGKRLQVNPKKPLSFRIPATDIHDDVLTFSGKVDTKGNLAWEKPQEQQRYLTPIPFEELKFTCNKNEDGETLSSPNDKKAYPPRAVLIEDPDTLNALNEVQTPFPCCDLAPEYRALLKDKKLAKTSVSTREFMQRLSYIRRSCYSGDILGLYLKNLDKNLWEIDSLAAKLLDSKQDANLSKIFSSFAKLKQLKIKDGSPSISSKIMEESLEKAKAKLQARYVESLVSYGFNGTELGWINCDRFLRDDINDKNNVLTKLSVEAKNIPQNGKVSANLIFYSVKGIIALDSIAPNQFGLVGGSGMKIPKDSKVLLVLQTTKDGKVYFAKKELLLNDKEQTLSMSLSEINIDDYKKELAVFSPDPQKGLGWLEDPCCAIMKHEGTRQSNS